MCRAILTKYAELETKELLWQFLVCLIDSPVLKTALVI